jgi:hypothetical protein
VAGIPVVDEQSSLAPAVGREFTSIDDEEFDVEGMSQLLTG